MWHNIKEEKPKERGQYLVVIDDGLTDLFAEVKHYFLQGDYITTRNSNKETVEERIHDFFFNDDLMVYADRSGFYNLSDDTFDAAWDRVTNENRYNEVYWSEMPEAPTGKTWGYIGSATLSRQRQT